jgi:hypothetical protein
MPVRMMTGTVMTYWASDHTASRVDVERERATLSL